MVFRLLDLAPELIAHVAEQLQGDLVALRSIALTSRCLQAAAEPLIYRDLFLRAGQQCRKLHESLCSRAERATTVSSLEARCLADDDGQESGLRLLPIIIRQTFNLRTLTIESPVCNYGHWERDMHWAELMRSLSAILIASAVTDAGAMTVDMPLRRLSSLTLHWNGDRSRYWTIQDDLAKLFALPSLEELTLSCATFPPDALVSVRQLHQIPLKHLTLIECNLTGQALYDILSRPRALLSLDLGENCHHENDQRPGRYNSLCVNDFAGFISALRQQSSSLEALHYHSQDTFEQCKLPSSSDGLASFERLSSIHMEGICLPLEGVLSDEATAPPHLRAVKLEGYYLNGESVRTVFESVSDVPYCPRDNIRRLFRLLRSRKSLKEVTVILPQGDRSWDANRLALEAAANEFNQKQTHVTIYREKSHFWGIIPPYLYTEPRLRPKLIYDSNQGGWLHGNSDDDVQFDDNEDEVSLLEYMITHREEFSDIDDIMNAGI